MKLIKMLFALLLALLMLASFVGYDLKIPDDEIRAKTDTSSTSINTTATQTQSNEMVWIPRTGVKYHRNASCSNMKTPRQVTRQEAEKRGYESCKKCY